MILAIFTSGASKQPLQAHESIEAIANVGLAGDRYATQRGFYSGVGEWDAQVTLIEREPFDRLAAEHQIEIDPKELRRNLVTSGVDLHSLIGREFRIGEHVVLRAWKDWPPCGHIVQHTGKIEIFKFLSKSCGIGAEIVVGGTIRVGDAIVLVDRA